MSDMKADGRVEGVEFEYELDASPLEVWWAISIPAFREQWLPGEELADAEPVSSAPGEEISFRMREDEAPFLESIVTFQVRPAADGGTILRIVHELTDARLRPRTPPAANSNGPRLMRAA